MNSEDRIPPAFVAALAGGMSVRMAGQAAGMSERTAYRRWARPEVRREVAALRAVILQEAAGKLTAGSTRAAEVLLELLESDDEKVRLSAACRLPELYKSLVDSAGNCLHSARPPSERDKQIESLVGGSFEAFQLEHGKA
jgi:hypothetical protein